MYWAHFVKCDPTIRIPTAHIHNQWLRSAIPIFQFANIHTQIHTVQPGALILLLLLFHFSLSPSSFIVRCRRRSPRRGFCVCDFPRRIGEFFFRCVDCTLKLQLFANYRSRCGSRKSWPCPETFSSFEASEFVCWFVCTKSEIFCVVFSRYSGRVGTRRGKGFRGRRVRSRCRGSV